MKVKYIRNLCLCFIFSCSMMVKAAFVDAAEFGFSPDANGIQIPKLCNEQ